MRITVFGAAGGVGRRIVAEALARGHAVTAVLRNPDRPHGLPAAAVVRSGDAANVEDVARLADGQDLIVGATRPADGRESELVAAAEALLAGAGRTGVRLLLVGGAGGLTAPNGGRVVDDPNLVPRAWRDIALACVAQYETCRTADEVDWTYLSPPAELAPGERTGTYRLGTDSLVVNADGRSVLSIEDLAVALLDEAEHPRHRGRRFTVAR